MDLELKAAKEILYLILERFAVNQEFIMDKGLDNKLMSENIGIISLNKSACIEWARQKVEQKGREIKIIDRAVTDGELVSDLNNLMDGDVVFINCIYIYKSQGLYELLQGAVLHNCVEMQIGKGDSARMICLDLPRVHYVLYAPEKRLFLPGLINDENIIHA